MIRGWCESIAFRRDKLLSWGELVKTRVHGTMQEDPARG